MKKKIKKSYNKNLKNDSSNTLQDLKEVGTGIIFRIVVGGIAFFVGIFIIAMILKTFDSLF